MTSKNLYEGEVLVERYRIEKFVGDGTFGHVYRGTHLESGDTVAIKKVKKKYISWEECMKEVEIKALRKLNHPNIVKLREVIKVNNELYYVFDFLK